MDLNYGMNSMKDSSVVLDWYFIFIYFVLSCSVYLLLYQIDDIFNYHNCGHPASLAF